MTIPAQVHFCWIGDSLPWAYVFGVLSAAERGGLPRVVLHHTDTLRDGAQLRALRRAACVSLSPMKPSACLGEVGSMLGVGGALVSFYGGIDDPVVRTDVLRAAILYLHGGVYLDLDTVTVATLRPLLDTTQFVGAEFIVWPLAVRASRSPMVWARHLSLDGVRKALSWMPQGWKMFRRIENLYVRGVNNAVMGAEPRGRLLADYLHAMLAVPPARQRAAYALGPDLLQEVVDRYQHSDLTVKAPIVFYPLPPEISEHWFRKSSTSILDVLSAETRVVHWYASVRTRSRVMRITPDYVRRNRNNQMYSALVCSCIRDLPQAA